MKERLFALIQILSRPSEEITVNIKTSVCLIEGIGLDIYEEDIYFYCWIDGFNI